MKIQFLDSCEIEVCESFYDALDDAETRTERFEAGEEVEFDVFGHPQSFNKNIGQIVDDKAYVNVQFPDGSVAFGLSVDWFEEV